MDIHGGQSVIEHRHNVVGSGFLASGLADVAVDHPHWTFYAAGPGSGVTSATEHARDAQRLYQTLEQCRASHRKLLYPSTSSAHLYGRNPAVREEDDPVEPYSAYGRHKLAMETVIRHSGVGFLILRLPNPVGPHQPEDQLVPALIRQIGAGRVEVWGGARRDLMTLSDIGGITAALLEAGVEDEVVNIGTGEAPPVLHIVELLCELLSAAPELTVQDTPGEPSASVRKLHKMLPSFAFPEFGPEYRRRILRDHLLTSSR